MTNQTNAERVPVVTFFLVLAVLLFLPVGPSLFLNYADASDDKILMVLDAVEAKQTSDNTDLNHNLLPEISTGIALLPAPGPNTRDYHYGLVKVSADRREAIEQRLAPLKNSPLYGIRKVRDLGRFQGEPRYLNQAFFIRTLVITESRCNCVKTFPFEVFGSPPYTPIGYGCFFDYARPDYLKDTWPATDRSVPNDRGTIKAPIHWGYDLCQSQVKEVTVECSMELSRQGVPIGPVNYSARPIAVRTDDDLYLVQQVPGDYPQEIKDCGMETRSAIHGFPIAEVREASDTELLEKIKTDTLNQLIQSFRAPPINGNLEAAQSDEAVLVRPAEKSDLMAGRYESSGYLVRVYTQDGTIYAYVRYQILAGDHPDGSFHMISREEMDRYTGAIEKAVETAQASIRKSYASLLE